MGFLSRLYLIPRLLVPETVWGVSFPAVNIILSTQIYKILHVGGKIVNIDNFSLFFVSCLRNFSWFIALVKKKWQKHPTSDCNDMDLIKLLERIKKQ